MIRRRLFSLLLCTFLLAAPSLAAAQPAASLVAGGVLGCDNASYSISNTALEQTLYQYTVPAGWVATQTLTPGQSATLTGWNWASTVPLHFRAIGRLRTNQGVGSPGSLNMGINFGGSTATLSAVNGHPLAGSLTDSPWRLDVYLIPYASATAANTLRMFGRFTYATQTGAQTAPTNVLPSDPVFSSYVLGTTGIASQTLFNVALRFTSATHTNSFTRDSACWKQAE